MRSFKVAVIIEAADKAAARSGVDVALGEHEIEAEIVDVTEIVDYQEN